MQPSLDLTKHIPPLGSVGWRDFRQGPHDRSKRKLDSLALGTPAYDVCRNDGLIRLGGVRRKYDRDLPLHRIQEPAVIRRVRVGAREGIVNDIIA
jgi:hypothetical protein